MPLYRDRVQTPVSFDRANLDAYKAHAAREGLTFSEWINKLCRREVAKARKSEGG